MTRLYAIKLAERIDNAANLVIGMRGEGREDFHLAGEETLLVG